MKIIYETPLGGVGVVNPAPGAPLVSKAVPSGAAWALVEDEAVPSDRTFRNAWRYIAERVEVIEETHQEEIEVEVTTELGDPELQLQTVDVVTTRDVTHPAHLVEDLDLSKAIAHEIRRAVRSEEFKPYDEIIAIRVPGTSEEEAEEARLLIRAKYETLQEEIDACGDIDELRAVALSI